MDPQACFQRIIDALEAHDWEAAYAALDDLFHWVHKGGFSPIVPVKTYILIGSGGTSYAIISRPGSQGAYFIRYGFSAVSGQMEETHRVALR